MSTAVVNNLQLWIVNKAHRDTYGCIGAARAQSRMTSHPLAITIIVIVVTHIAPNRTFIGLDVDRNGTLDEACLYPCLTLAECSSDTLIVPMRCLHVVYRKEARCIACKYLMLHDANKACIINTAHV